MTSILTREEIWKAEAAKHPEGRVFCNLCGNEVIPGDEWDRSHIGVPAAFNGSVVSVGHRSCNARDNVVFVRPFVNRTRRLWRKHHGIDGPGLGPKPMAAGKRSSVTKKLDGSVEPRLTGAQKHARTMAALWPHGRPE